MKNLANWVSLGVIIFGIWMIPSLVVSAILVSVASPENYEGTVHVWKTYQGDNAPYEIIGIYKLLCQNVAAQNITKITTNVPSCEVDPTVGDFTLACDYYRDGDKIVLTRLNPSKDILWVLYPIIGLHSYRENWQIQNLPSGCQTQVS